MVPDRQVSTVSLHWNIFFLFYSHRFDVLSIFFDRSSWESSWPAVDSTTTSSSPRNSLSSINCVKNNWQNRSDRLNWCYIVNLTGWWHTDARSVLLGRSTTTLAWGTSFLCSGRWGPAKEHDPMTQSLVLSWECCVTWISPSLYDKKQNMYTVSEHFGSTWQNNSLSCVSGGWGWAPLPQSD